MSGRAARAAKQRKMLIGFKAEEIWEAYQRHGYYIIHSPKLIWMDWNDFNKEETHL
jgi:hypothetical protein